MVADLVWLTEDFTVQVYDEEQAKEVSRQHKEKMYEVKMYHLGRTNTARELYNDMLKPFLDSQRIKHWYNGKGTLLVYTGKEIDESA